jgi:hypothetical protein
MEGGGNIGRGRDGSQDEIKEDEGMEAWRKAEKREE